MWNGQVQNQHFVFPQSVNSTRIPYELVINLPKPRYERIIVERDEFGRIVHSKALADYLKDETQSYASMVECIHEDLCFY